MISTDDQWQRRAEQLDAADPLAHFQDLFIPLAPGDVVSYLDGNSLGRPLRHVPERMARFIQEQWAGRLIRGWTDEWMQWPDLVGDRLGSSALGAAAGQVIIADSTTVLLYKLSRAALSVRGDRTEIVLDTDNFPTDRYVLEGIALELGLTVKWVDTDPAAGLTVEQVSAAVGPRTALVVFSHVAYRSGFLADAAGISSASHDAGALVLADLSHSAGSVVVELDSWGVDLAVGCGYKYLNGGPGAPAFAYVRREHQGRLRQPIWGWIGRKDAFTMGAGYLPADGMRSFVSGTPPILAMLPLAASLETLEAATIEAVRTKSELLTQFAVDLADAWLVPHGVVVDTPRDPERRGGHITLRRNGFREINAQLWDLGVIGDYRDPDAIRIGMAPLSTSFAEVHLGLSTLRRLLGSDS